MLSVTARYQVQLAHQFGLSRSEIQERLRVSARSQQRILQEAIDVQMTNTQLRTQRGVGRPSALSEEHRQLVASWVADRPNIPGSEVLRRLVTSHNYRGGRTAFYAHFKTVVRPKPAPAPIVRFEGLPGEFAQHDFGEIAISFEDGRRERLKFYAARLKYSRVLYVTLVTGETAEVLIRAMGAFYKYVGGSPRWNTFDNTKAAVTSRKKDPETGETVITLQADLACYLARMGVIGEPTYPYSGNQKGSVENLVGFVKHSFFECRTFRNRTDVEQQLNEWLRWTNHERRCDATNEIPFQRLEAEKPYLKPPLEGDLDYGLIRTRVVGRDAWVQMNGMKYSAPAAWIGQCITVKVYCNVIALEHEGERVEHPRYPANGKYSLLDEHLPSYLVKPRGELMVKRQLLIDLGGVSQVFFTELIHRRPGTWRKDDLPRLGTQYEMAGAKLFIAAVQECVEQETIGAEYVEIAVARLTAQGVGR